MNLSTQITDNVTELLVKIIKFTEIRQKVLIQNIKKARCPDFIPKDLEVREFSAILNSAITEHIKNRRLVLYDTENIKFCSEGNFEVEPVTDEHAAGLLKESHEAYLKHQTNKLMENSVNQSIAEELLKRKEKTFYCLSDSENQ